jgi:quercetin dioxygenase-like cupin family protein
VSERERGLHPYVAYLKDNFFNYAKYQEEEGLPVLAGHHVDDIATVPVAPWARTGGGLGTFINLSEQEIDDAYVLEIPPATTLTPQRHMYEAVIFVAEGHGATSVWNDGEEPVTFEWQPGSFFAIPLNAHYRHINAHGSERARLLAVTSAPLIMNLYHSRKFIYECPYVFRDRFDGARDGFSREGVFLEDVPGGLWETNFIADLRSIGMTEWHDGEALRGAFIALAASVMKTHVAEFAVGTYKKAHRHGPGAHILILEGSGYTLMWKPGEEPTKYPWRPGSLISPPAGWYHQHFNTGPEPVFHMAVHRPASIRGDRGETAQIEYEDEDPAIRQMFVDELNINGVELDMPSATQEANAS